MQRLKAHLGHLAYQAGRKLVLGGRRYRLRGYLPNRFSINLDHEPHVRTVITRLLKERPGAFIDIGANVGQTLTKVLRADPGREYVGFEPQIMCCAYLTQFIADNRLANAQVLPVGLGATAEILALRSGDLHDVTATTLEDGGGAVVRPIPVLKGDEVLEQLGLSAIAVIKIDVEGAELEVIEGLRGTLAQHRPAILFELFPNFTGSPRVRSSEERCAANRSRADRLEQLFEGLGYGIFQIDDAGRELPITRFQLDDPDGYLGCDYLALPLGK